MNQTLHQPFVFLVDSPSHHDLFGGYSIGMALRDALRAIRIPCFYTLATSKSNFETTLLHRLPDAIHQMQPSPNINSIPFVHLCMHGADMGVGLTDHSFLPWIELRNLLLKHRIVKGHDPYICMASCNGFNATNMATAFDPAFSALIGNTGAVLQSDVTVAYLSFYNHLFFKMANLDQAVIAMRQASGDPNFYYIFGEQVKNQKFLTILSQSVSNPWPNPQPSWLV
ncbi:hypothetical protein [Aeromonas salmonicida]|uniref:hypothetical protein n=1 Tax=Aeromonas salmonicida TaxID=645 RepID=UPI000AE37642|nr:hypothetical protein [Aeromonas salmonicida]MDE7527957.1 hypothetical protein [Aeromonas salmonicida]MDE7532307.1 hypothetical protein [Aeromonas salmonicida]